MHAIPSDVGTYFAMLHHGGDMLAISFTGIDRLDYRRCNFVCSPTREAQCYSVNSVG